MTKMGVDGTPQAGCQRSVAMRFRHTELALQPGLRLELSLECALSSAFSASSTPSPAYLERSLVSVKS
jgi:hypothetical protein